MIHLSFTDDWVWKQAKELGNELGVNDWTSIVTIYRQLGGDGIRIYCNFNGEPLQIIGLADTSVSDVLLVDNSNKVIVLDTSVVEGLEKQFSYSKRDATSLTLPNSLLFLGKSTIKIKL